MMRKTLGRMIIVALAVALVSGTGVRAAFAGWRFAQNWRDMSPTERYEALQNYRRHQRLPRERQNDIEKRYQRWQQMSPDERKRVRQNYDRLRQLPPHEREQFQQKYEKWRREGEPSQ